MEEDIKILENFTQYNKFYKEENGKLTITIDLDVKTTLDKAIENLIKAYKELEENISKEHTLGYSQGVYDCSEAWKETIKEKIEELKDKANRIAGTYQYADSDEALENKKEKVIELRIKAEGLEELLGEEK